MGRTVPAPLIPSCNSQTFSEGEEASVEGVGSGTE